MLVSGRMTKKTVFHLTVSRRCFQRWPYSHMAVQGYVRLGQVGAVREDLEGLQLGVKPGGEVGQC